MKYNAKTLKRIESLYKDFGFKVRYGRGNFQSGHCILESRNIVVVNRLFDEEAKIGHLMDILWTLDIDPSILSDSAQATYQEMLKEREKVAVG